jgi:ABC-type uncharacterized transport system substrate-binding protein
VGLVSYGANLAELYRLMGTYVGRILKGESAADLPVQAPTKYELVINLKTATSFSLRVGPNFLVPVVHRVVPAKLATRKSDGFVLIGKRSHRLAARAHDPSCSRQ